MATLDAPQTRFAARFAADSDDPPPLGTTFTLVSAQVVTTTLSSRPETTNLEPQSRYELETRALRAVVDCPATLEGETRFALSAALKLDRPTYPTMTYMLRSEPRADLGELVLEEEPNGALGRLTRARVGNQPVWLSGIAASAAKARELKTGGELVLPANAALALRDGKRIVIEATCEGGGSVLTLLLAYERR